MKRVSPPTCTRGEDRFNAVFHAFVVPGSVLHFIATCSCALR